MIPARGARGLRGRIMASLQAAAMTALIFAITDAPETVAQKLIADPPADISVRAKPIQAFDLSRPGVTRFGALEFRGGVELTSHTKSFGGLSALRIAPDGEHLVSLSDRGFWMTGRIVYDGERLVGLADAKMAAILAADGRPITARGWYDTESLAQDGGQLYVGLERVNRILRFDFGADGMLARGQPVAVPPGIGKLPDNKGLEAMAFVPGGLPLAGTLIAMSERGLDAAGNIKGFLIGGPTPGEFSIRRSDDFDISDATLLPSGDLVILERKFSWTQGVAMRLRRLSLSTIAPGATVDGTILLTADMGYQIDNMEGIAAFSTPAGETILTLISDDNFSLLQRTILLQFRLVDE